MYLTYFDEVKYNPPTQSSFILGGITINIDYIASIERDINEIANDIFGKSSLEKDTEFHAVHIFQGKGIFKNITFEDRLLILKKIVAIFDKYNEIHKTYIQIQPENVRYTAQPPADIGFMFFVEQIDSLLESLGGKGILFGDYDDPVIGSSVASLSRFRQGGTYWTRSREIRNLVDTVHFAHSHHSRLIQLADIFVYCIQFFKNNNTNSYSRKALYDFIKNDSKLMQNCRTRIWPLEPVWYRTL